MPIGDIGGACSTLIISCIAGEDIEIGEALSFTENYQVIRNGKLFGKAIEKAKKGEIFPVAVRGLIQFTYMGPDLRSIIAEYDGSLWAAKGGLAVNWREHSEGDYDKILFQNDRRVDILL